MPTFLDINPTSMACMNHTQNAGIKIWRIEDSATVFKRAVMNDVLHMLKSKYSFKFPESIKIILRVKAGSTTVLNQAY